MDAILILVASFAALAVGIWLDVKKVDRIWCFVIGVLFALLIVVLVIEVLPAEAAGIATEYLPAMFKDGMPTPAPTMPVGTPFPFPTPAPLP